MVKLLHQRVEVDDPMLLQSVSQYLCDALLLDHLRVQGQISSSSIETHAMLTTEEDNIVRYVCGLGHSCCCKQSSDKATQLWSAFLAWK